MSIKHTITVYQSLVVATIIIRLIFGPLIFWFAWPATIGIFFVDWADGEIYKHAGFTMARYQLYDKILDYYWYIIVMIYLITSHAPNILFFLFLFLVRSLGHIAFFFTRKVVIFFFFPNIFEVYFYFYLFTGAIPNLFWLILIIFIVLVREYVLHIANMNLSWIFMGKTTHWIDEKS